MDLKQIENNVKSLAIEVGDWIRKERLNFNQNLVENKDLNDLVSYVDKTSEIKIIEGLKSILPNAGFIVEEGTESKLSQYNWIVDPLDGTTNFVHGINCYAISIALECNNEILVAVVYEITFNECFHASKNNGAFLNGINISVSTTNNLANSLIATGFPVNNFTKLPNYFTALEFLIKNTHGIRRIGAAAADLCFLACGRVDGFFEHNLKPWDVAAGALIVKEAGGFVTDFNLQNNWLKGGQIIACNKEIYSTFAPQIANYFNESP